MTFPCRPKTIKYLLFILLLPALFFNSAYAQTVGADSVAMHFNRQLAEFPQEKIYLQTDKSAYLSGERIWFRPHLVDALSHTPAFLSRYIYVELISPMGDLMDRVMIRPDSTGAYSGHIVLADDLIEGTYTLRAYTNYMRNQGESSFFKKAVEVLDPFSLQIDPHIVFDVDKNKVSAEIEFTDRQTGEKVVPDIVSCKFARDRERTLKPGKDDTFIWNVTLPKREENRTMLLSILWKERKFNRFYTIPFGDDDFEVALYPEGGYLIPETINRVAYKAMNPAGMGEDISGVLYNSKDEALLEFKSLHLGMGFISFLVQPDENYYVLFSNSKGVSKRVDLPDADPDAVALSARIVGSRIIAAILGNQNNVGGTFSLVAHQRGVVLYHEEVVPGTEAITFPSEILPFGLINLMLLDDRNNILSERLVFNYREDFIPDALFSSNEVYKRREKVELKLTLPNRDESPLTGNFALSVTDKNGVQQDTTNTIVSELLLSSELKGYIENPASYFKQNMGQKHALDALLMTQGWRRYDIPKVLKGEIEIPEKHLPEMAQRITGKADGLFGSLKEGEISLMATLDTMVSTVTTQADAKGRFEFNVEYPAGTSILVQSLSKRGSKLNAIDLDLQTFPEFINGGIPLKAKYENRHNDQFDSYLQKADDEYTRLHGIRTIMLEEVTVVAKAIEKYKESTFYSPLAATGLMTGDEIENMRLSSFKSLLYRMPGVVVKSDRVTSTRSDTPILFVIADMRFEDFFDRLDDIDVNSIESIFVVRDNSMMPGYYPGTDGAIVITTKIGFVAKPRKPPNIDQITLLGYQQPAEFYSPLYDTPEKVESSEPDLRTTIYWKPNLLFSENGEAIVEFYAADLPTDYRVILEGVTDNGLPLKSEYVVKVEGSSEW